MVDCGTAKNRGSLQSSSSFDDFFIILIGIVWAVSAIVAVVSALPEPCIETGDYAANAFAVLDAKEGVRLLGPYSRLRFYHPGPIIFYWRALFEILGEGLFSELVLHVISQVFLNIACFTGALFVLRKELHLSGVRLYLSVLPVVALSILIPDSGSDTWGPTAVLYPFVCCVVCCVAVSVGRFPCLPWAVLSGVIVLHTHLATAPFVVSFMAGSLLFGVRSVMWQRDRTVIVVSFLIALVGMLPIAIEATMSPTLGNVGSIVRTLHSKEGGHSLTSVARFLAPLYSFGFPTRTSQEGILFGIFWIAVVLGVLRFGNAFEKNLIVLGIIGVMGSFWSLLSHSGRLYSYLAWYHYTFGFFVISVALSLSARRIQFEIPMKLRIPCVLILILAVMQGMSHVPRTIDQCSPTLLSKIRSLSIPINGHYKILSSRAEFDEEWMDIAGIALGLRRLGYSICISRRLGKILGLDWVCMKSPDGIGETTGTIRVGHGGEMQFISRKETYLSHKE
ncbi:MAG: hypothetical protein KDD60_07975 [Bdellovibrionales bacterium]|nr:hypothetical protein [Bdellovibrionales bacterium]